MVTCFLEHSVVRILVPALYCTNRLFLVLCHRNKYGSSNLLERIKAFIYIRLHSSTEPYSETSALQFSMNIYETLREYRITCAQVFLVDFFYFRKKELSATQESD